MMFRSPQEAGERYIMKWFLFPRLASLQSHLSWLFFTLPPCKRCSIHPPTSSRLLWPCFYLHPIRGEDGCFLYGVFNGYDGSRVSSFASQCLTAELLLGQLNSSHSDNDVRGILTQVSVCVRSSKTSSGAKIHTVVQNIEQYFLIHTTVQQF